MQESIPNRRHPHTSCADCSLSSLCLPLAMELKEIDELDAIIKRSRPYQPQKHVYRAGDLFSAIYAVRSGSIKVTTLTEDGIEQVTGFYLPGEIFGLDGIHGGTHSGEAKAMETSSVCEMPFDKLETLSSRIPKLQHHFFQIMSKEIQADQRLMMMLSKKNADERVASFLLSISARQETRKLSGTQFRLPMSRADIANYLGLTVETVSRVLSRLQKSELVEIDGREIKITQINTLCHMANSTGR